MKKNRLFAVITAAVLSASVFGTPFQTYIGAAVTAEAASYTAAPQCSRASGKYYCSGSLKVTLSCADSNSTIYYSTDDGSTYKRYTKALYITKNTTLKYYAVNSGVKSKVVTRTFKLLPRFTITPSAGSYDGTQTIYLSSSVSGLKFYYTLDGSTPTTSSMLYTAKGITIDKDCTLRIRTAKSGWSPRVVTKTYNVTTSPSADEQPSITVHDESLLDNYKQKYYYNALTDKQRSLYELIYNGVSSHKEEIYIADLGCNAADVEAAFYAMDYDNPQFFWLDSGYTYSYIAQTVYYVRPSYTRTAKEAAAIEPKLEAAAEAITKVALTKDNLFERVVYLHDAVINRTTYVLSGGEHIQDADGVLLNGLALCEGYSKAFAYLCQSIGIECICVIGSSGGSHMWNMVKLDGEWYHFDVTFDDPVGEMPVCTYTYFGLTTEEISETHTIDEIVKVPRATATKYNYYSAMGIQVYTDAQQAYNYLVMQAATNYKNGVKRTEIICTKDCVEALHKLTDAKGSDIFSDLKKYDCSPNGLSRGYNGTKYYFELE